MTSLCEYAVNRQYLTKRHFMAIFDTLLTQSQIFRWLYKAENWYSYAIECILKEYKNSEGKKWNWGKEFDLSQWSYWAGEDCNSLGLYLQQHEQSLVLWVFQELSLLRVSSSLCASFAFLFCFQLGLTFMFVCSMWLWPSVSNFCNLSVTPLVLSCLHMLHLCFLLTIFV
jgi:hypothetical protein